MDSLLTHIVNITGNRDHAMLDISAIAAVQELARASKVRVLNIVMLHGGTVLVEKASILAKMEAVVQDPHVDPVKFGEPIDRFPGLATCLDDFIVSAEHVAPDGTRTLWFPIWMKDKAQVCLEVVNPLPFSKNTIRVILGIVSVYRNFQNLLDYSERDALTGLLNRKTFDEQLAKMIAPATTPPEFPSPVEQERRHPSEEEKQWLAVVDVDHFKRVNDQFGHIFGDEVLILVANLMQSSFRSQDRVFRFGGEEFVVLLRSATLENAQKVIERFRKNVEEYTFPQIGCITVSVGFVSISPYVSPVMILGYADQAMYYAKTHGRNMACHYDELVSRGLLETVASNDIAEFF